MKPFAALLLPLFLPLALAGCGHVQEHRKTALLDSATSGYRQALRWGYYDAALQHVHPEQRAGLDPARLANLRVSGYEVVRPPVIAEDTAEQWVRIEYVYLDRQRLESLLDRQQWRYDADLPGWWLISAPFGFEQSRR